MVMPRCLAHPSWGERAFELGDRGDGFHPWLREIVLSFRSTIGCRS